MKQTKKRISLEETKQERTRVRAAAKLKAQRMRVMLRSMEKGSCTVPQGPTMTQEVKKSSKATRPIFTGGPHNAWYVHQPQAIRERAALKIQSKYRIWKARRILDLALANVKPYLEMERKLEEEKKQAARDEKRKIKERHIAQVKDMMKGGKIENDPAAELMHIVRNQDFLALEQRHAILGEVPKAALSASLYTAVRLHRNQFVLPLVQAKADVNALGFDGHTPLHRAVDQDDSNLVAGLQAAKADASKKNLEGVAAWDIMPSHIKKEWKSREGAGVDGKMTKGRELFTRGVAQTVFLVREHVEHQIDKSDATTIAAQPDSFSDDDDDDEKPKKKKLPITKPRAPVFFAPDKGLEACEKIRAALLKHGGSTWRGWCMVTSAPRFELESKGLTGFLEALKLRDAVGWALLKHIRAKETASAPKGPRDDVPM